MAASESSIATGIAPFIALGFALDIVLGIALGIAQGIARGIQWGIVLLELGGSVHLRQLQSLRAPGGSLP